MYMKINIPTLSEKEILKKLKGRRYEDLELIKDIEKRILKKRNYVVSPIKEGENIILLLSGGIDSIITWALLLKHYKANVYPFYLANGFRIGERFSIFYYGLKFRHLKNYRKPYFYKISKKLFKINNNITLVPPELILELYSPKMKQVMGPGTGANFLAILFAGYYKNKLLWDKNISTNKIISAVTANDGIEIHTQTHTFARLMMLNLILITKDAKTEYYSLGLEKNLGSFLEKIDFINLSKKLNISIDKTHSCPNNSIYNCKRCSGCRYNQQLIDNSSKNSVK